MSTDIALHGVTENGARNSAEAEFDVFVVRKEKIADDAMSITLRSAGSPLPEWSPGAHIDLVLPSKKVRQYSLCGDPSNREEWRLGVLREQAGRGGSAYVCDELAEGTRLTVRGPRNHFALVPAASYLFIAGGIGITPILPMLRAATQAGARLELWYGGRRASSMAFVEELGEYGDRVHLWPQDERGLLPLDELLAGRGDDTLVYCCGPAPLLEAAEARSREWPTGTLHVERFAPIAVDHAGDQQFEVELARSRKTLTVLPGTSILHTIEAAGVFVLSSCQEGTCGTCETDVLEGTPDHRDCVLTEAERAAGDIMMICVSRSRSSRLVLDL
ncbi:MAG TPA: PDR/VanB family oxidoreductase [Candidatus Tumulicola sp.]|nr:PDR/VanB family oxidoreductase [Candidatus Tumulicola sp.]